MCPYMWFECKQDYRPETTVTDPETSLNLIVCECCYFYGMWCNNEDSDMSYLIIKNLF